MFLELDYNISDWLFSLGRSLSEDLVIFLASWLIFFLYGYVGAVFFFAWRRRQWGSILRIILAAIFSFIINLIIAYLYFRTRPYAALGFSPVLTPLFLDQSFPSSHAAVAWALAVSIWFYNKKNALVAFAAAALISIGRVLAGVHYLSDVLAGGFIGLIAAWLVLKISFKIPPISRQQKK